MAPWKATFIGIAAMVATLGLYVAFGFDTTTLAG
jgi:hypothetical protein